VLKVPQACKDAIDAFYNNLDTIDKMAVPFERKSQMKTKTIRGAVREAGFRDKLAEFVINSYISSIGTPAVNLLSALVKPPLLIAERLLVSMYPKNDVRAIEAYGMFKGFWVGLAEGISFAKQGWIEGMPLDTRATADVMAGIGKGKYLSETGGTLYERAARPIEKYLLAPVVPVPTKVGVFVDEYAKAVFRRMQLNALAYRVSRSVSEKDLNGRTRDEIYKALRTVDISDPTKVGESRVWKENLRNLSLDVADELTNFAKVQTFQAELGEWGNKLLSARQKVPEIVFVAPFIKTPINIFKDTLTYTPAVLAWKGLKKSQGLSDEAAAARMLLGSGIAALVYQNVLSGDITGSYPKDAGRREAMIAANIPEYSVKILGNWYSFARIEPLASLVGVFADASEDFDDLAKLPEGHPDKTIDEFFLSLGVAVSKNLTSKTFLEGITGMLQAVHDPERYGMSWVNSYAGLVVPGAVAQFARGVDPVQRQVDSFSDALKARIPGMREDLPVRYTITGEERKNLAQGFPNIIGIASSPVEQTQLQRELQDTNFSFSPPDKKLRGVKLKPEDYSEYSRLAGEAVNQRLSSIINSPYYPSYSEKQRKVILERAAENARSGVSKTFFGQKYSTDPEFRNEFLRVTREKKGLE
jgi:hypothetical protein